MASTNCRVESEERESWFLQKDDLPSTYEGLVTSQNPPIKRISISLVPIPIVKMSCFC